MYEKAPLCVWNVAAIAIVLFVAAIFVAGIFSAGDMAAIAAKVD